MSVEILLITGPACVGKSTLCWEMGAELAAAGKAHAIIETDELDRVYPKPDAADLAKLKPGTMDVSSINLAALWSTYRALGHSRLIMPGVMLHLDFDRRWILQAIPAAEITVVRLLASEATLLTRLAQKQARRMADQKGDGIICVPTDGETPQELARIVLRAARWLES